jgi:hypothetical protein
MADDITVVRTESEIQIVVGGATSSLAGLADTSITSALNNDFLVYNGSAWANEDAAAARSSMGLGTIATQAASAVTITGGSVTGITDITVADGGTGSSTASGARTNLGLGTISTQAASSVAITGGAIDGTTLGATTASSGKFTTIDATGAVTLNDNTLTRPELKDYAETKTSPSSSAGVLTLDLVNGNVFEVTLTENVTTTNFNNPPATGRGGSFTLILKQNVGAGHTFTWPASVDWAGGTAPTLTTTVSAVDILTFVTTDAGTRWYGFLAGAAMA